VHELVAGRGGRGQAVPQHHPAPGRAGGVDAHEAAVGFADDRLAGLLERMAPVRTRHTRLDRAGDAAAEHAPHEPLREPHAGADRLQLRGCDAVLHAQHDRGPAQRLGAGREARVAPVREPCRADQERKRKDTQSHPST
jgi:hypothetical protein